MHTIVTLLFLLGSLVGGFCVCPDGWSRHGPSCYHLSHDTEPWTLALQTCEVLGGHLPEINSADENNFIAGMMYHRGISYAPFIALTDLAEEGIWVWMVSNKKLGSDGFTYSNWEANEPNNGGGHENCADLHQGGTWNDATCSIPHYYICEKPDDSGRVLPRGGWSKIALQSELYIYQEMAASDKGSDKNTEVITQSDPNEDYGYYFFPRRQDQQVKQTQTNFERFKQNPLNVRAGKDHYNCKLIVKRCFISDPLVNLMIRAMKAHGCPVEHDRHIVCEPCRLKISGGMDYINNQVVVCENNARSLGSICNVMAHELLHAFDKCRSNFDYRNPEHIACTEIRAANLLHCSFSAAMSTGSASPFRIKEQQQQCVKDKASISLMIARNISKEKANEIINKVFSRCYNDLEPVGRRLRKGTLDDARALLDADLYGYFR